MLNAKQFILKYVIRKLEQMKTKAPVLTTELQLPIYSSIVYSSDVPPEYGIRKTHPLLINNKYPIRVHHITELDIVQGKPRTVPFNISKAVQQYFKSRPSLFTKARNYERVLKEARAILVNDYSLVQHIYRYQGRYAQWDAFANIMHNLWQNALNTAGSRECFLDFRIPDVLPKYNLFRNTPDPMPLERLKRWEDVDSLALKFVWDRLAELEKVDPEKASSVYLVFTQANHISIVNLGLMQKWLEKKEVGLVRRELYALWTNLYQLKTDVDTQALEAVEPAEKEPSVISTIGALSLNKNIQRMVETGRLSAAEQKRLWRLSEKYKSIPAPEGEGTLSDYIKADSEVMAIDHKADVIVKPLGLVDESMTRSTVNTFTETYVRKQLHKDVAAAVVGIQGSGILVQDYKVKKKSDPLNDYTEHTVKLVPINGRESTVHFKLPVVQPNGTFKVNGTVYRLDAQRSDLPIRKTASDRVALTSYYGKLFIERSPNMASNYGRWIVNKLTKASMDSEDNSVSNIRYTTSALPKKSLPRAYTAIGKNVAGFTSHGYTFIFDYKQHLELYDAKLIEAVESEGTLAICGHKGKDTNAIIVIDEADTLHTYDKGKLTPIAPISLFINEDWGMGPVEYTRAGIFGKKVPLILILSYYYGLESLLSRLDQNIRWVPSGGQLNMTDYEDRIRFKGESLIYDRRNRETALLLSGFNASRTAVATIDPASLNRKEAYGYIFDQYKYGRYLIKEIDLMEDLFIDPITLEILTDRGEPTSFDGLLEMANTLLKDDNYSDEMDTRQMRIRGYERFSGFVYKAMVSAIRDHRNSEVQGRSAVQIPKTAIWQDILKDQSKTTVEESNPIHNLKEKTALTFTGEGGRSNQTMVASSRLFTRNDMGIISEATPDSGKVGIRTHLTPAAKIKSLRGITEPYVKGEDGMSSLLSVSSLFVPGTTHMDAKRTNMGSVQLSSMVFTDGGNLTPVRTGEEMVIAQQCDDNFAYTAKADGKVIDADTDALIIEYTDMLPFTGKPTKTAIGDLVVDVNKVYSKVFGTALIGLELKSIKATLASMNVSKSAVEKADPNKPALIYNKGGQIYILDGAERLQKAMEVKREKVLAYKASESMIKEAVLAKSEKPVSRLKDVYTEEQLQSMRTGIPLGISHGKVAGAVIPHNMVTDLVKGKSFKKGDCLVWNEGYFKRDLLNPGGVSMVGGVLTRMCLMETNDTLEDSSAISNQFAEAMATNVTKAKTVLVRFDEAVTNLVSVGDHVDVDTPICNIEEGTVSDLAKGDEALLGLSKLTASAPKAKFQGVVSKIEVVYQGDTKDMHKTLRLIANADSRRRKALKEKLNQPIATTGQIFEDAYVDRNKVVPNTMAITVYMDHKLSMGVGDKLSAVPLKSVVARVMEGKNVSEDGQPIDMYFGNKSISNRIVPSAYIYGTANTALIELGKRVVEAYKS